MELWVLNIKDTVKDRKKYSLRPKKLSLLFVKYNRTPETKLN